MSAIDVLTVGDRGARRRTCHCPGGDPSLGGASRATCSPDHLAVRAIDGHHDIAVDETAASSCLAARAQRPRRTPCGTAESTKMRSPHTTGVPEPRPGISTFQRTFLVSLHSVGGSARLRDAGRIRSAPLGPSSPPPRDRMGALRSTSRLQAGSPSTDAGRRAIIAGFLSECGAAGRRRSARGLAARARFA
mgnify:CR=1 FL=1